MKFDPYTLVVALSKKGTAKGELYVDDGESFDYENGAYIHREFEFADGVLASTNIAKKGKLTDKYLKSMKNVGVEKLLIVGAPKDWEGKTTVKVGSSEARMEWHGEEEGKAAWALIKAPKVSIADDWKIEI